MKEHSYVETVCYILMGLSVLVVFKQLFAIAPVSCYWIIGEGMLYRRCGVVFHTQRALYALGFSFLRTGRVGLPPCCRMAHSGRDINRPSAYT